MLVGQIDNLGMGIVPIHFVNFDGFIRESPQSDSEADSDPEAAGPGNWIAFWHGKTQTWPIHDMSYNTHTYHMFIMCRNRIMLNLSITSIEQLSRM